MDKVDLKKKHCEIFFCIFLQFTHQVDMKNIVECEKEFFAYFNALETYRVLLIISSAQGDSKGAPDSTQNLYFCQNWAFWAGQPTG